MSNSLIPFIILLNFDAYVTVYHDSQKIRLIDNFTIFISLIGFS